MNKNEFHGFLKNKILLIIALNFLSMSAANEILKFKTCILFELNIELGILSIKIIADLSI